MSATEIVIDPDRIGRKGVPRHYAAFGVAAPVKVVEAGGDVSAPALSLEQQIALEVQALLDDTARSRGYDSALSAVSYIASTVPAFAAEAAAVRDWRDAVWAYAYAELAKAQAGARPIPTVAAFLDELPAISWPASE